MRENIGLYRGKVSDEKDARYGKWVYGNLITYPDDDEEYAAILTGKPYSSVVRVDPETVGECTGLKDKNGRLIFEGDIVDILMPFPFEGDITDTGYVMWDTEDTKYIAMTENKSKYSLIWENGIIGNIYNNPELIESGDE